MPHITRGPASATMPAVSAVMGWDIGGANVKAARLDCRPDGKVRIESRSSPFELQRNPGALAEMVRHLAGTLGGNGGPHAVTMTAELSQAFRSKREGVREVLNAVEAALPGVTLRVYTVGGRFISPAEARSLPFEVGASNWAATARLVARFVPDCLLIDIGTTSTDIIPVVKGEMAAVGRTDPERLVSGELVYTGALRTPCEAVAGEVPLVGAACAVSAEGFALMGDVYLWTGRLAAADYTVATPDGRPATREFVGERLARLVCADREMLDDRAIVGIAQALVESQIGSVARAIRRVRVRHPQLGTAVVTGLGEFIAADAARGAGMEVLPLADWIGDASRTAPAAAVAWLLSEELAGGSG